MNLDKYGNTSAASVPIALAEAVNEGRVKVGDNIVIVAFGAGFTSGAVTIEWTADPARGHRRRRGGATRRHPVRLPVDWDSVDPIPEALAEMMRAARTRRRPARRRRAGRARPRAPGGSRGGRRMIDLSGKSALVTGGSRGIGRAIVLRLATQGADVAFTYKGNAAAAAETAAAIEALGRRALAIQGDASQAGCRRLRRQGRARCLRQARHPRQQRRDHPRRPHHADVASRPGARSSRRTCSARSG